MNELCFIIEDTRLYLDQVLIDYNEDPVFYVCRDDETFYLVLCTDIGNMQYYISRVEVNTLSEMVNGEMPMRDAFLRGNAFWAVSASDNPANDTVRCIELDELKLTDLPKENARFDIYSPELQAYGRKLKSYDGRFIASLAQRERCSIILKRKCRVNLV